MVHAYTASGAVLALAMTVAVIQARYRTAFLLMVTPSPFGSSVNSVS